MGGGAALTLLFRLILMIIILVLGGGFMTSCSAVGITSIYVRNFPATVDMPYHSDVFSIPPGFNAPQQVHLTQGDHDGRAVIVSWVTKEFPGSSEVLYWTDEPYSLKSEVGIFTRYNFYDYVSGYIHHVNLTDLAYSTKYYYSIGFGESIRTFCFHTPPPVGPDVPYTFGVIGDLGQTYDSNRTLAHYMENPLKGEALLFVGDLAYADHYKNHDQVRWDTFGRFIERSAAYQPFIWAAGNHELDFVPDIGEIEPFKPFLHRYPTPYPASQSISPLWYSIKRASAYIIVLSSYSAYGKYTPQYVWLEKELGKVNRSETPWLIVMVHSPWYNSYDYHYMEGETMRVQFESWFVKYKVDVVFAGHVHAYERTERVSNIAYDVVNGKCNPLVKDQSAPVYITIGDGGNIEGLASRLTEPQPAYSAFREQSFGHAMFSIKNRTHAYYSWNRNQDGVSVEADKMWFFNRIHHPVDDSTTKK